MIPKRREGVPFIGTAYSGALTWARECCAAFWQAPPLLEEAAAHQGATQRFSIACGPSVCIGAGGSDSREACEEGLRLKAAQRGKRPNSESVRSPASTLLNNKTCENSFSCIHFARLSENAFCRPVITGPLCCMKKQTSPSCSARYSSKEVDRISVPR
jgi:hypothetical protein